MKRYICITLFLWVCSSTVFSQKYNPLPTNKLKVGGFSTANKSAYTYEGAAINYTNGVFVNWNTKVDFIRMFDFHTFGNIRLFSDSLQGNFETKKILMDGYYSGWIQTNELMRIGLKIGKFRTNYFYHGDPTSIENSFIPLGKFNGVHYSELGIGVFYGNLKSGIFGLNWQTNQHTTKDWEWEIYFAKSNIIPKHDFEVNYLTGAIGTRSKSPYQEILSSLKTNDGFLRYEVSGFWKKLTSKSIPKTKKISYGLYTEGGPYINLKKKNPETGIKEKFASLQLFGFLDYYENGLDPYYLQRVAEDKVKSYPKNINLGGGMRVETEKVTVDLRLSQNLYMKLKVTSIGASIGYKLM